MTTQRTHAIVVYCPTCDYFLKTAVQEPVGTHGCVQCHQFMEVYVPQELASPHWTHRPPSARRIMTEPRVLSIVDLFPPEGHRYWTDDRIEQLRRLALDQEDVTLSAQAVMELICDWRNMAVALGELIPADQGGENTVTSTTDAEASERDER